MSGDLNLHALNDGAPAFRCHSCHDTADWRITRRGDAVVEWACQEHLAMICTYLQRDHEITELVITDHRKATCGECQSAPPCRWCIPRRCWGSLGLCRTGASRERP